MRIKRTSKVKTFIKIKSNSDSAKNQVVPKKWKIDVGFLGCVEGSTNGDLLGEIRNFVPSSGPTDANID
jgi:hypothetical protein